jgi:nucleotide-binding universal stress UspA family protein
MPPMLRAALRRLPISAEEEERLEREEFEAKGFVPNLERLLIAVDESANGRFASRLAGLLAGVRGIPASVLHVDMGTRTHRHHRKDDASAEAAVQASAAKTAKAEEAEQKFRPSRVEVTTLERHQGTGAAVAFEAQKGYDFLIIGVDEPVGASGEFCPEVEGAAGGFDGPMAVVVGRGQHVADPRGSGLRILLPVTGSTASRRGAEVAVTIARADKISITALYVATNATEAQSRYKRWGPVSPAPPEEEAILKDVVDLADRYHIPVRTVIRADVAPHLAIRDEARNGGYDLIVMGVSRRPGSALLFGKTASKTLVRAKVSMLLVSS